jgi:hypothetical protein
MAVFKTQTDLINGYIAGSTGGSVSTLSIADNLLLSHGSEPERYAVIAARFTNCNGSSGDKYTVFFVNGMDLHFASNGNMHYRMLKEQINKVRSVQPASGNHKHTMYDINCICSLRSIREGLSIAPDYFQDSKNAIQQNEQVWVKRHSITPTNDYQMYKSEAVAINNALKELEVQLDRDKVVCAIDQLAKVPSLIKEFSSTQHVNSAAVSRALIAKKEVDEYIAKIDGYVAMLLYIPTPEQPTELSGPNDCNAPAETYDDNDDDNECVADTSGNIQQPTADEFICLRSTKQQVE